MASRARIGGQPVHPILVVVPIALFPTAVMFDFASLTSGWQFFGEVGYWDLSAGLFTASIAMVVGLVELVAVRSGRAGWRTTTQYVALTAAMLVLFGLAWYDRMRGGHAGGFITFAVEVLALAAGGAAVWQARALVVHGDVTSTT
jgi:uncharacterized membrane protein